MVLHPFFHLTLPQVGTAVLLTQYQLHQQHRRQAAEILTQQQQHQQHQYQVSTFPTQHQNQHQHQQHHHERVHQQQALGLPQNFLHSCSVLMMHLTFMLRMAEGLVWSVHVAHASALGAGCPPTSLPAVSRCGGWVQFNLT